MKFIVDGGHNPQCLEALAENVREYLAGREIVALTGVMADKDYTEQFGKPAQASSTVEQGVLDAMELAGKDGVVLAFGSLYMTGTIRETVKNSL